MITETEASVTSERGKQKKSKNFGRVVDAAEKMRNVTHETADDRNCKWLACFINTTEGDTKSIISYFNRLKSVILKTLVD